MESEASANESKPAAVAATAATSSSSSSSSSNNTDPSPMQTAQSIPPSINPQPTKKEYLYKILVVGDLGTGKTSIIKRYVHNIFSMHYKSTIGVDFALKVIQWTPGTIVRIQLWDIAGQERFGNMTRVYYKEAVGALVVYDVSRISTFEGVSKWKADLDDKLRLPDGSRIPAVLLANKIDLQDSAAGPPGAMIKNQQGEMDKFCQEKQFMGWFGTSAKEDKNIEDACRFLISKILENDQRLADMQMSMTGGGAGRAGRRSAGGANGGGRLVDLNDGNNTGANGKPSSSKAASGCCV